jgi:hypothetical protein
MASTLLQEDLDTIVASLPAPLQEILKQRGSSVVIAGGFIRACVAGEKPSDIDLFVPSQDVGREIANALVDALWLDQITSGPVLHESPRAYTVRNPNGVPVQVIHRWVFPTPADAIKSFDFTIAKAAVWWKGTAWESVCDPLFYHDVTERELRYCSPIRQEAAAGSLFRVFKFYKRGYSIPLESLCAVIARLCKDLELTPEEGENARRILDVLKEAGSRVARPQRPGQTEETPDDTAEPIGALGFTATS